jgi:hypothetical protein
VRFLATLLLWLLTTAALAVALPAAWAQVNVVDREGYSALAASAARDPALQSAVAAELTTQLVRLGSNSGYEPNETLFGLAARAYTASPAFPGQFALANQVAHRWLFTDTVGQSDESGRWTIDLAPMLADSSFQKTLTDFGIKAPSTLSIPLTEDVSNSLRPGQLHRVAQWGPWVSIGAAVITGMLALLTLIVTRSRGKVLGALGISALLVGAAGWAGIEVGRPYVNTALNDTSGNVRRIADAMVDHAIGSMHLWLNLTLGVGGVLVFIGFVVSTLGGLGKRD